MSEEEKKAIEYWKRDIELYHYNTQLASEHYAQIVLNLIEKQEKVIDEIKYKLEEQIQFCNREKNSSENNHICYLSVGFYEKLLDIINKDRR